MQSIAATFIGNTLRKLAVLASFSIAAQVTVAAEVIEFYNTNLDNYFITADPIEAAAIDGGAAGPGWSRTGTSFGFNSGGTTPVCRFYGSIAPGPNSHFYTALAEECASLKQLQLSTPATQKRWNFESLDFLTSVPASGNCASGTVPVYRAYNNGFSRGVDSNHRITSSQAALQQVTSRGWINEGVVMCAPAPVAAANCAALLSGTYRIVTLATGASVRTLTAKLNAATMTFTFSDGRTGTWSADGPCKFVQAGVNRFAVSPSGVAVWTSGFFGTGTRMSLMFPEQSIPLAELAGTWNALEFSRDNATQPFNLGSFVATFSTAGQITAASECVLLAPCTPLTGPFPTLVTNQSGGFNASGEPENRWFAYLAPSGDLMLAQVDSDSMLVATKTRTVPAPTVGATAQNWTLTAGPAGAPGSDFSDNGFTITAVDQGAKTYTRVSTIDGHTETLSYNKPRDGLSYRAAATAATSSGGTVNVNEIYILGLPGTGVSVISRPNTPSLNGFYGFSVNKP